MFLSLETGRMTRVAVMVLSSIIKAPSCNGLFYKDTFKNGLVEPHSWIARIFHKFQTVVALQHNDGASGLWLAHFGASAQYNWNVGRGFIFGKRLSLLKSFLRAVTLVVPNMSRNFRISCWKRWRSKSGKCPWNLPRNDSAFPSAKTLLPSKPHTG